MINNSEKDLLFVSMKQDNIEKYKKTINKIGDDYILLFDIDETLYKSTEELKKEQYKIYQDAYNKLRTKHINSKEDIKEFNDACREHPLLYETLHKYFGITQQGFENLKRPVDYGKMVRPDLELRNFLLNLPFRKWVFTNGLKARALPILQGLGLMGCFEGVICFSDDEVYSEVIGKPKHLAYDFVEALLKIENKNKVFFFDDHLANIQAGKSFGWNSYHVRQADNIIDVVMNALSEFELLK